MNVVVGTAGHIDHGKTTLLRSLTGMDADRLPEEQRRGMTIDVGYAHLALDDGSTLDFVDVPGHDRLVGNMLVGAGEVDAVLLVVAADDGPRAQTVEHLELVDALGLRHAVVAITKEDAVEPARIDEVTAAVHRLIAPTVLAAAPVLAVSAVTGSGLAALRTALLNLRDEVLRSAARPPSGPRLSVDRVFSARGRGTVVTGSLRGGTVARGDLLTVEPGGGTVRVREVQVHGRAVERSDGGRTALNVAGAEAAGLRRGQVLAPAGCLIPTDRLLVVLAPPAPLRDTVALPVDRARLRLHLGTDQVEARVGRSGREAADLDGLRATAVLRLARPVAAAAGDRFVLRRSSPGLTAAGGFVLDAAPPRGASRRRAEPGRLAALAAAVEVGGDVDPARLALHGALPEGRGGLALAADVRSALAEAALAAVAACHAARPGAPGLPLTDLRTALARRLSRLVTVDAARAGAAAAAAVATLVDDGRLERLDDAIALPGRGPVGPDPATSRAMERLVAALDAPAPPALSEAVHTAACPPEAIRDLERGGRIVRLGPDLAWATPAWERLARRALDLAEREPLSPAVLRDETGTSRKYVLALLEDLDRRGILRRTPAGHVPGPRAAVLRREPVS